ncbi:electron transfer flavoprotein subunit beta/FixA family protein [Candidatus Saganbacteria bacterium]|nr:electron transfer flavoprotein subunit beta/FixA family protein [Candidatus Saganbacteria bacterium]
MRIVVSIKQVPDVTDVKIDPVTNTLIREGVPSIANPYDLHALEEALKLKDQYGAKVIAISMGPPQAKEVLRKAISLGADETFLLTDRGFAGADTLATSYVLSEAIRKLNPDLVLCGKQAIDGDTAQVGPGIATRLGFSQLTYVAKIRELNLAAKTIIVERKLEEGIEVVSSPLPALLTILKEANQIRYATLPNLMSAVNCEPPVWDKNALSLDPGLLGLKGSPTQVVKIFSPPLRTAGKFIPPTEAALSSMIDSVLPLVKGEPVKCDV